MYYKLKKGKQRELIQKAIKKAGSERKLCKLMSITKGVIQNSRSETYNISGDLLRKLLKFLNLNIKIYNSNILSEFSPNWGQIKGGNNLIKKKIEGGVFEETIKRLRKGSSKYMKGWHKDMKENSPKEHHIWQYERFKKVGRGYRFSLKNKVLVRNRLEKQIGDFLISQNVTFEYEPYINIKGKVYFPDFKIGNKIIEVTEWKHPDEARIIKLRKKIGDYKGNGFDMVIFIPQNFRKFYKEIGDSIISALSEIKTFLNASVA